MLSLSKPERLIRLNVGCGSRRKLGYINVDKYVEADRQMDIVKLDFDDESVTEVRAVHVLEHVSIDEGRQAVSEWVRVLKPNGKVHIEVPDFAVCLKMFLNDPEPYKWWIRTIYGLQSAEGQYHKCGYTFAYLKGLLEEAGMSHVTRLSHPRYWDAFFIENLVVEAIKR